MKILKKLYNWTMHWAHTRRAHSALFLLAFAESSCFPVPPDVLLIPMVIADRKRWHILALICTIGSILGGIFGYLIGWGFFELIGQPIIHFYHLENMVTLVGQRYEAHAFITIFTAAFTPIPYKAITITAGMFRLNMLTLIIASILGRGGRFFMVALALKLFGKKIQESIEKYFNILSIVFVLLLIGGIICLKYL